MYVPFAFIIDLGASDTWTFVQDALASQRIDVVRNQMNCSMCRARRGNLRLLSWDIEGDAYSPPHEDGLVLHIMVALSTLIMSNTLLVFCSKFMVEQVRDITSSGFISVEFLGLVVVPLAASFMEFKNAVSVAMIDKLELTLAASLGRSISTILLAFPIVVLVGWIMGNDTIVLELGIFPTTTLVLALFILHSVVTTGKSNYWNGVQMFGA
ncbi:uncharacterized protein PAC_07687 [Phialocephala subalpina]|uniref:Sodium/calcium exchanger membrane region domain-containing protein n=1 Tax=Phialocephala subalpina TaxID=576137 RepID=A0A1L7WYE9_9HELO|nr:uncharacterized protein PAC_07687 [Phialocephala subalpina]